MQTVLTQQKRIVVKVGSSLVTNQGEGLDRKAISNWRNRLPCCANQDTRW